jgi:hypothetical protein
MRSDRKIETNAPNVAKRSGGHHRSKLCAELAKQGERPPLLGDDDRTADQNYIREVVARDRELGRRYGVEYAAASGDPFGANDEPVGGGTNEVKGITGDQGEDLISAGIQYRDIGWAHYLGGHDAITGTRRATW